MYNILFPSDNLLKDHFILLSGNVYDATRRCWWWSWCWCGWPSSSDSCRANGNVRGNCVNFRNTVVGDCTPDTQAIQPTFIRREGSKKREWRIRSFHFRYKKKKTSLRHLKKEWKKREMGNPVVIHIVQKSLLMQSPRRMIWKDISTVCSVRWRFQVGTRIMYDTIKSYLCTDDRRMDEWMSPTDGDVLYWSEERVLIHSSCWRSEVVCFEWRSTSPLNPMNVTPRSHVMISVVRD